ncbi:MAG TPA: carboxyl transferase domain-containing protein [Candidatus Dormibacteraeota bacterium]|nr:carboxyl transferase domain-containing protein [Candidatus Dormibacteraeota bacterium]
MTASGPTRPFRRIAIVNRGEPAMRLIHAVRELNRGERSPLTTIALYTDHDERALFVREADESVHLGRSAGDYVDLGRLEEALRRSRAEAAWVGWGFVAERPEFAELCERLGVVFIGPSACAMRRLGDKIASKRLAEGLGVPLAPWSGGPVDRLDEAQAHAERIGFPLLVKASAGGGGRGVRRVDRAADLGPALESARAEARAAFGDPTLFMERLIERARHVEVQVAADGQGGVWALGVRDCSIQRRHQKIIEESSSTALDRELEAELAAAAAQLCRAADYRGLATVEFLLDPADGSLAFMEVNARLQVEHPVTEAVTGVDLVKLQLHLAAGGRLEGEPPAAAGHAVEARLCAEDADGGFAPAPGVVELLRLPGGPGIRVDTGVVEGDEIPAAFDSMIAKVIAWGRDRHEALDRLTRALRETVAVVRDGTTNRDFLLRVLRRPEVERGTLDTAWLERAGFEAERTDAARLRTALLQAAIEISDEELRIEQARFYASAARGRPEAGRAAGRSVELSHGDQAYRFDVYALSPDEYRVVGEGGCAELRVEQLGRFERRLVHRGRRHHVLVVPQDAVHLVEVDGKPFRMRSGDAGLVRAPSPAVVVSVLVAPGDRVSAGAAVAVLEAMKMESAVLAPISGTVGRVLVNANVQVGAGTPLVQIEPGVDVERPRTARISLRGLDDGCGEPEGDRRTAGLLLLRRLMLGFDADAGEVRRAVSAHSRPGAADASVRALEDDVLTVFADVCALSRRRPGEPGEWGEQAHSPRDHFFDYLRSLDAQGRGLPSTFLAALRATLAHYGVTALERTPALEQALFRIFKAHLRVEQQLPAVMAILERRVEEAGDQPAAEGELHALLDRIVAATERRFPAVADLAREARYRSFHQPEFERARGAVYAEMGAHLDFLADQSGTDQRSERMLRLVDCPQPMQTFLSRLAQGASPERRRLMLEVLIRRYYRIRPIEDVRTFDAGGRTWGTARYVEEGRRVRVLNTLAGHDELPAAARAAAATLATIGADEEWVVDLHLWDPEVPADPDAVEPALRAAVESAGFPAGTARVLVSVSGPGPGGAMSRSRHFTYRRSGDRFEEDRASRGLHPMMAERLDLWRLDNFRIDRLPSVEDVYLFHGVARENPADERLFAIAEVRDVTPVRDEAGRVVALPHLERMFLEALAGIRRFQAHRAPGERLQWNRVMLHVWPTLDLRPEEMHAIVNRLAPATEDLGMEKTVVQARMVEPGRGEPRDTVLHLTNPLGAGVMLMRYDTPANQPIQPLSEYRQKVVQMRRRGLVYPFEIVGLLAPAADGPRTDIPPGEFTEHDLEGDGRLVPVARPYGRNTANLVVGVIRNHTWKHPEGMARVIVLGDPSRSLGALAEPECRRIIAALDLADEMGVPVEWFALSSGARISMDSGTENMDWIAAVLRRLIEFTQTGGEVNIVVNGVNVGAQPYWNAEATMLMHTRGILVMTPDGAMVLTGKQALDYSGGVSAEDNFGIGGYEQVMGRNGQAQYYAPDLAAACRLLLRHYEHTYRCPGERFPRPAATADPRERDVRSEPHPPHLGGLEHVGDIFSDGRNPERKHAFDVRSVMAAVVDHDLEPMERWLGMRGAETAVTWDAHLGGYPVCLIGFESRLLPRHGPLPADGPHQWTAGTLFPLSSKKVARAINAASGNRPVVVLANLSGFDGSPESMRDLQLEFGAEIGRAVVNFRGPMVFCVISRYHGGAFVVFSNRLNEGLEVAAVEGSHASVIGGAPAAAVVFAREVERRARADERVRSLERRLGESGAAERLPLRAELAALVDQVRSEKLGEVAREFDAVHSVDRAQQVGSVHRIVPAEQLRPYLIDAVERGMRRELAR